MTRRHRRGDDSPRYPATQAWVDVREWVDSLTKWPTDAEIEAHTTIGQGHNKSPTGGSLISFADVVCLLETRGIRGGKNLKRRKK